MLQDQSLEGTAGFKNDRGPETHEGFMGLGLAGSGDGSYNIFSDDAFLSQWNLVWMVMDPAEDTTCEFKPLAASTKKD